MKKITSFEFRTDIRFFVLTLLFAFSSCQKETNDEIYSTREIMVSSTPLSALLKRVAMQKTAQDNIIDNTNYFMIKLPYQVTVNGSSIAIDDTTDYALVQNNINAFATDDDIVYITFPVSVVLDDYSERYLGNQTVFNNLVLECQAATNHFGKINCLTINYPVVIAIYNDTNQMLNSLSITNDRVLYNFINNLSANQYISIGYPINIINQNGQNITIANNSQLEDVIKGAIDNCAENPLPVETFEQIITAGTWKISYFYDENELTSNYYGYNFTFYPNNTAIATKSGTTTNGTWRSFIDDGKKKFEIKFQPNNLNELDESWSVFEFNTTQLHFRDTNDGNLEIDYLYLQKN